MKAKILVVDDEEGIRFSFNIFLAEDGYEVSTAASYSEAIELINKTEYDLIFADIILDRKTGKQLLLQPFMMPGAPTAVTNFSVKASNTDS